MFSKFLKNLIFFMKNDTKYAALAHLVQIRGHRDLKTADAKLLSQIMVFFTSFSIKKVFGSKF